MPKYITTIIKPDNTIIQKLQSKEEFEQEVKQAKKQDINLLDELKKVLKK